MSFTIHIAGPVDTDGRQRCLRCGLVLIDSNGCMSTDGSMCFWQDGGYVGTDGYCSVLMDRDAAEIDEVVCGRAIA